MRRQNHLKDKIIEAYEGIYMMIINHTDQIRDITKNNQRTIVHLRYEIKELENKLSKKDEIIEKFKEIKIGRMGMRSTQKDELVSWLLSLNDIFH